MKNGDGLISDEGRTYKGARKGKRKNENKIMWAMKWLNQRVTEVKGVTFFFWGGGDLGGGNMCLHYILYISMLAIRLRASRSSLNKGGELLAFWSINIL